MTLIIIAGPLAKMEENPARQPRPNQILQNWLQQEFSVYSFSVNDFPWDISSLKETVINNYALIPSPSPDPPEIIALNRMISIYIEMVLFLYLLHIHLM